MHLLFSMNDNLEMFRNNRSFILRYVLLLKLNDPSTVDWYQLVLDNQSLVQKRLGTAAIKHFIDCESMGQHCD